MADDRNKFRGIRKSDDWGQSISLPKDIKVDPYVLQIGQAMADALNQEALDALRYAMQPTSTKKPSDAANYTDWYREDEERKKQKYEEEGRCEQCGIKMEIDPRSWHFSCPIHGAKYNKHGF